jgi:hypothetical protein
VYGKNEILCENYKVMKVFQTNNGSSSVINYFGKINNVVASRFIIDDVALNTGIQEDCNL